MAGRYRVRDGVRVVVAGVPHSNGATFEATAEQAAPLLQFGWVAEVGDKPAVGPVKSRPRKRTA